LCGQQRRRRFAEFSSQAANRWASANAGWRLWGAVTIGRALTLIPIIHLRAALSKIQHWCRAAEMQVLESSHAHRSIRAEVPPYILCLGCPDSVSWGDRNPRNADGHLSGNKNSGRVGDLVLHRP